MELDLYKSQNVTYFFSFKVLDDFLITQTTTSPQATKPSNQNSIQMTHKSNNKMPDPCVTQCNMTLGPSMIEPRFINAESMTRQLRSISDVEDYSIFLGDRHDLLARLPLFIILNALDHLLPAHAVNNLKLDRLECTGSKVPLNKRNPASNAFRDFNPKRYFRSV